MREFDDMDPTCALVSTVRLASRVHCSQADKALVTLHAMSRPQCANANSADEPKIT